MLAAVTNAACWLLAVTLSLGAGGACARRPLPAADDAGGAAAIDATTDPRGAFVAIAPCPTAADYVTGTSSVAFGFLGSPPGFSYDPACLAVEAGAIVTFSGSFVAHPLYPSARRGMQAGNPIGGVSSGDSTAIAFPSRGFFAYYCGVHGASDDGSAMAGVIWVQ